MGAGHEDFVMEGVAMVRSATVRRAKNAKAKSRKRGPVSPRRRRAIDLYYWPTPNGYKVSIMLEECGLPGLHPVPKTPS